ncbi:helix-turn-helix domain-containing protein [Flavobacterium mesophilum]|uniref:helix-turn-helix domain-containing protein n=1 Tax=Flavobacterium mesophilum TaxID=3143495 RepID=UPI0031DDD688
MSKNIELYKKQFGANLKKIREAKKLTQLDLATAMNNLSSDSFIEKTTISRIENARTNVTLSTMIKLSIALEVDIKMLLDFE